MSASLLLAGCGKMGGALLAGWLEGEYAAATSLTPSAGAHLGSVRDRYAYSRYISLLYASTFVIGVAALASVRRRMSSDAVHVAIARGAVPTYGAVDV